MKRIIAILTSVLMITSMLPMFGFAASEGNTKEFIQLQDASDNLISISKEQYDELVVIPQEEAKEIAMLFVKDEISLGDVVWNNDTYVVDVIEMYDESDSGEISAYTIKLNEGYVVVSAYRDSASLIPEWSDGAEPLFSAFEKSSSDSILYLGPYCYYLDTGSTITDLDGHEVERENLINKNATLRDSSNIPKSAISEIFSSASTPGGDTKSGEITNPIAHANSMYDGPFVCNDYINYWENNIIYYTMDHGYDQGYAMHCGPTAITNLIVAYMNRYQTYVSPQTANDIFDVVAQIGTSNNYFINNLFTPELTLWAYMGQAFNNFNISINNSLFYYITLNYNNLKAALSNNNLLYVMISNHPVYSYHAVACFAYTRLISQSTGYFKTYLKVADGLNNSGRYIDLSTVLSYQFYKVVFN